MRLFASHGSDRLEIELSTARQGLHERGIAGHENWACRHVAATLTSRSRRPKMAAVNP